MAKYKKRKDGLYRVDITVGILPDGRYKRKSLYAKTIRELEDKIQTVKEDSQKGITSEKARKMTFEQLSNVWLENFTPNVSERGRCQYKALFRLYINPEFGAINIRILKNIDLQRLLNSMAKNGSSRSQLKKIKMLSCAVLNLAEENGIIAKNVFKHAKLPEVEQKIRQPLTDEQKTLILQYWSGHRMGIPALIMLLCGLRRGEILALQWSDVDLTNKQIIIDKAVAFENNSHAIIKKPKTAAGKRVVEIPEILVSILRQCPKPSIYVCPSAKGVIMSYTAFVRAWKSYMLYLSHCDNGQNIQPFTPHQLRHTYATMLYSAGVDVLTAQKLMGHSDIKITMGIYTHLAEEKRKRSIAALDKYMSNILR